MSQSEPPPDLIRVPIPGTNRAVEFSGFNVFVMLLIMAGSYVAFSQLRSVHDELEKLRADLLVVSREVNCKLDLDIYMYGRPPEKFQMRDMPAGLFKCLPSWVSEQQIAPRKEEK